MKRLFLAVSLILLGLLAPKVSNIEQPSLAGVNNPLSLTCPEYSAVEHNINANPNFAKPEAGLNNIDQSWYSAAVENIIREEYNISYSEDLKSYHSPNRANNLRFIYHKDGFTAQPRVTKIPLFDVNDRMLREDEKKFEDIEEWSVELRVENGELKVESGELRVEIGELRVEGGELKVESGELRVDGNRAWMENAAMRTDYVNTKEGMRQDFTVKRKPAVEGKLEIVINAVTELDMHVSRDEVKFSSAAGDKMQYASLKAWDANSKTLDAYFEKRSANEFAIVVNDEDAVYPVTVDPLSGTPDWWLGGDQQGAYFGNCSAAGDVNGDGYDDVIISAEGYDNGQTDEGRVFAFYGSPSGLPGVANWSAEINQEGAHFGISIASAGDVNGDGFSDILVGAVYYDNGQADEGGAFVYYGSATGLSAVPNWTDESNQSGSWFGTVESAGDVNSDGYSDIIIGARHFDGTGRTFAYYGSATGLSAVPDWTAVSYQPGSMFGAVVSSAGDVNSDGYSDVIVGAPFYSNGESMEGKCFVYLGSGSGLAAGYSWTSESNQDGAWYGWHVANAGDVNGDGYDDVLIGAVYYDNGESNEGAAFVYHGNSHSLENIPAFIGESNQANSEYGSLVATAGDVNADGFSDILIGAPSYSNGEVREGRAYIYTGSPAGLSPDQFWTQECNYSNAMFGHVLYTAGDVNGDGVSDIVIGATGYDGNSGRAFVYHGVKDVIKLQPDLKLVDPGMYESDRFGLAVSGAGDVNGDGCADFLISDPENNKLYLYYGSHSGLSQIPNWTYTAWIGRLNRAGDINADGYDDFLVGNFGGSTYCFFGSQTGPGQVPNWTASNHFNVSNFGWQISPAGDYNNDGYDDIVIGGDGGSYYAGEINFGSGNGLSDYGYPLMSDTYYQFPGFGSSIDLAGDVNGDGTDELIVGSPNYYGFGAAFIYTNQPYHRILNRIFYPYTYQFGSFVKGCGDINSDGFDDVMVSNAIGEVRVFTGSQQGIVIWPEYKTLRFPFSSFYMGDYDGDGLTDDILSKTEPSEALLYLGMSNLDYSGPERILMGASSIFGYNFVGDINCDGLDDIALGSQADTCRIFYGKSTNVATVSVVPRNPRPMLHTELCLTATVRDEYGQAIGNRGVFFKISGSNRDSAYLTTNNSGKAVYCYVGNSAGFDTIQIHSGNINNTIIAIWDYPQPVELLSLTCSIESRNVTLSWSTSSELNNSGFEIQRRVENGEMRVDGWSKIGFISGSGTTNEPGEYSYTDRNLETGKYKYRLKQLDFNGNFEYFELAEEVNIGIPDKYDLSQNYPNPFNPVTTINYDLPSDGIVTLKVYDILGRELKTLVNEMKTAGYHKIQFNAADLASGAYFYQLKVGEFVAVKKFVVLK